ncbi:hypothetical protein IscW_ISCW021501 [Ixodes scapularis]|uniref:Uncharacterized protein n=1 Tax=Ixodes scapularis TaxID=6945 RepID=B7Q4Z6_IXOSC|nr:hypothetical protein IscW_ISCW021501 [Ixodes scapularis]|eukprot:XP_002411654.1 hypothetical protein IscW_ISCW021501 [Ixodes scapularis]
MSELGQVEQRLLLVLVEFDSLDWKRREWIRVYEDRFSVFLVEETLAWHVRNSGDSAVPALVSPLCLGLPRFAPSPVQTTRL